jgi:hypothetical protein
MRDGMRIKTPKLFTAENAEGAEKIFYGKKSFRIIYDEVAKRAFPPR